MYSFILQMKKVFSIIFTFLILLSGMHLSIATHICGGEVASVKWSFSGKIGSCGMENFKTIFHPGKKIITRNCCHNKLAFFKVDNNYSPSNFQIKDVSKNILKVFFISESFSNLQLVASNSIQINFSPPHNFPVSAVSLPDICVFRI
jgi:hypothetical protein